MEPRQVTLDKRFLDDLKKDPASTLRGVGIEPTPEMVDAIRKLDFTALQTLTAEFEKTSIEPCLVFP